MFCFFIIQLHSQLLRKVSPSTIFLMQHSFFNPTIRKPTTPAFQNILTSVQYLFNSRNKMNVNLVHWNSLHRKKAIIPTFSGQTPNFLGENYNTRTKNLYPQNVGSVAVILSLRVRVQHIQKVVQ